MPFYTHFPNHAEATFLATRIISTTADKHIDHFPIRFFLFIFIYYDLDSAIGQGGSVGLVLESGDEDQLGGERAHDIVVHLLGLAGQIIMNNTVANVAHIEPSYLDG